MNTQAQLHAFIPAVPARSTMRNDRGQIVSTTTSRRWVPLHRIEALRQIENGEWRADTPDGAFEIAPETAAQLIGQPVAQLATYEQPPMPVGVWASAPDPTLARDIAMLTAR